MFTLQIYRIIDVSKDDDNTGAGGENDKDDDDSFMCAGCPDGFYGVNCAAACGQCANNVTCYKNTGLCPSGCKAGYRPQFCNTSECYVIHILCLAKL